MSEISLPQKIFFGDDSVRKFAQSYYENILILSDAETVKQTEALGEIKDELEKNTPDIKLLVSKDFNELYEKSIKYISEKDPDRLVAVGSAWLMDAAMFISYQSGVDFAAVPYFSSCSMTDFDNTEYRVYRRSPVEVVLNPDLAMQITSGTVAYDSMSCFAYAAEALMHGSSSIISSLALSSAAGILNHAVGAYRGNFKSIARLQYSMYCAVLAYRNSADLGDSMLDEVTSFFAKLGIKKQTAAAICIPDYLEHNRCDALGELARRVGLFRSGEDVSFSVDRLIERVRRIQASLNIPRSIGTVYSDRELYSAFCENTHLPSELLDTCFYGSFKFMKL